ncbi:phosphotransferase, partial [Morganella morganii]|uniref:phosphotransferase n=1 Tax=Morganella morganii TaxID=582 RepID=UPI003F6F55F3
MALFTAYRLINVRLSAGCRECSDAPLMWCPAIPGVPAADLSGADLLKAWPSMGQQLGAVHSLSVDQCPFERRLSRMFGRAVDVVSRN